MAARRRPKKGRSGSRDYRAAKRLRAKAHKKVARQRAETGRKWAEKVVRDHGAGYGGVVRAPDGTVWQIATSTKKDTGPAGRDIDEIVLLLGVEDVRASKRFHVERGLAVGKSFGGKYVEFATAPDTVKLSLYKRRGLAKVAGVDADGTGSHRLPPARDGRPRRADAVG